MYPLMLPEPRRDDNGFSSFRNPDDLLPERQGVPPDRLGWLFVRFLERLSDGWDAILRRRNESLTQPDAETTTAGAPVAHPR